MIYKSNLSTPLGEMVIYASNDGVIIFTNVSRKNFNNFIEKILKPYGNNIIESENRHIELLKKEMAEYFNGTLKKFKTNTVTIGTSFQQKAWDALKSIPYGCCISYQDQAKMITDKNAVRAIGGANSQNPIEIIIPCHRVISKSGKLTGFASGLQNKEWLLNHEKTVIKL